MDEEGNDSGSYHSSEEDGMDNKTTSKESGQARTANIVSDDAHSFAGTLGDIIPASALNSLKIFSAIVGRELSTEEMHAAAKLSESQFANANFNPDMNSWAYLPGITQWGCLTRQTVGNLIKSDYYNLRMARNVTLVNAAKVSKE
jgi:hypothetical protein